MGWINKAPSGRWKASYRDPARRIRSRTFDRKADAERWLRHTEVAVDRGSYVDPARSRQTLSHYLDHYFETAVHLRLKTRETYLGLVRNHVLPALGARSLGHLTPRDIDAFVAESIARGVSPATTAASFRVLRLVLSAAERESLIARNPARGVKLPPQPKHEMRFLTADEVARVAEAVPNRYQALVLTLDRKSVV